jgi:hypothetical protein
MLNLDISSKFHTITIFIIVDLKTVFPTQNLEVCVSSSSIQNFICLAPVSVITSKPKSKYRLHAAEHVVLHSTKNYLNKN